MRKQTERIIHLDDMFIYILKRWKIFLLGMLITGIIFSGRGIYKVNEKYKLQIKNEQESKAEVTVSEEEQNIVNTIFCLEQAIADQKEYNENSILMKINPYEKKVAFIKYQFQVSEDTMPELRESRIEQGKKAYQCIFNNEDIYRFIKKSLSSEVDEKYFKELIGTDIEAKGVIIIAISAPDEELAQGIQRAIESYLSLNNEQILNNYKDLRVRLDSKYILTAVDTGLQGVQSAQFSNSQSLLAQIEVQNQQLSDNAKQYLTLARMAYQEGNYEPGQILYKEPLPGEEAVPNETVELKRKLYEAGIYAVKRLLIVACLFIICLALKYMWSSKLMYAYDVEDMYGINTIDILVTNDSERMNMTIEKILLCISDVGGLVLVSSNKSQKTLDVLNDLKNKFKDKGIEAYVMAELDDEELVRLINYPYDVIMVESIGKSRYSRIKDILRDIKGIGKDIKGTVIVEDIQDKRGYKEIRGV